MRKLLLLLILPFFFSCTNYYSVTIVDDTPVYQKRNENTTATIVIPKNEQVHITKKGKYRKIKYRDYTGWVVNPNYTSLHATTTSTSSDSSYRSKSSSSNSSSSGTVRVKGYTRKDGTYVKPHTRKAPKRRS